MAKPFQPKIVTANDLFEGDVIYLTADLNWSRDIDAAAVARDGDEADRLLAAGNAHYDQAVGPYLATVRLDDNGDPQPDHFREVFRTRGPSNYPHGKQAEL
jgi:hypothetical protein